MSKHGANEKALFKSWKNEALNGLDLSRKGSVDEPIQNVVKYINESDNYFTTSSCSGRVAVYEHDGHKKVGCRWLHTSHVSCSLEELNSAIGDSQGSAFLKFEPFIVHIQCRTVQDATSLHAVAISSGFRNSGISLGKKGKIIVAVRSTHGMEVPLTVNGKCLVSQEYLQHLVQLTNERMGENLVRINRFSESFHELLEKPPQQEKGIKERKHKIFVKKRKDQTNSDTEDTLADETIFQNFDMFAETAKEEVTSNCDTLSANGEGS